MNEVKIKSLEDSEYGYHPLFIVLMILSVHILLFSKNYDAITHQITLRDFDGYWHLVRATDLYRFGNINETIFSRSNAPYGESLHWTKAFDIMLYAGAYAGAFFSNFNVSLLWWSIIINPILHVLTFLVIFWSLRDFIGEWSASIFGILFPFQPYLNGIFDMGVPDHHGAQIFLFSLFISLTIKTIFVESRLILFACGIAGGLSLWFGIESLSVVLIAISFFAFLWILEGKTHQSKNLFFSFSLLITTLIITFFDTKSDEILKVVYDRTSIVHVFLFLTTTFFWFLIDLLDKWTNILKQKNVRIITATIGAAVCILLMYKLFPNFFINPLSEIDPLIKVIYLDQTDEFTGLFTGFNIQNTITYIYWAMALPAIPISIFLSWHHQDKEKYAWIFLTMINIFYIFLPVFMSRMITYATLCALIPISYVITRLFLIVNNKFNYFYYRIARTVFILICCLSFIVPAMVFNTKKPDYLLYNKKFLPQFCEYLNDDPFFKIKPRRILTSIYLGPLLLYKTAHEVIGTPSHRNVAGILDTYHVMNARKPEDAHIIIQRRGIDVLVIGRPELGIADYFVIDDNDIKKSADIFHHQLWRGNIPSWLKAYPVKKSLEGKIKIFRVLE